MKKIFSILTSTFLILNFSAMAIDVVELKMPKSNKVVIELMFRNGSISDPAGKEGLADLTASVLTEGGTATMTHKQITDRIYPWAAGYSGSVDKEVTVFRFEVPSDFADQFYDIVKGLILTASFTKEDFDRVKNNQQNYVEQVIKASSDEEYSKKALEDLLFRGTNYQHLVQGTASGVKAITLDDVKKFYKAYFAQNNLTIGIAGNYSDAFLEKLKKDMAGLPAGISCFANETIPAVPATGRTPDGIQIEIISKDKALGSAVFTGFPLPVTRKDDDFAALMIANSWLGEHRKSYSLLYRKIREQRSMNYGDYSYIEWYQNGGQNMLPTYGVPRTSNYFSIWLRPVQTAKGLKGQYPELSSITVGHAHYALRMALREMNNLVTNGLTQEQFEQTRDFLRSYNKLYVQDPAHQLGFRMDSHFYGRTDYITEMDALLAKLTVADVNNAMKKYWQTNNMFITIVTDASEAEPLAASLKANKPSPMSYSNNLKGSLEKKILDEDEIVAKYPLNVKSVTIVNSADMFK